MLSRAQKEIASGLPPEQARLFTSREPGSFDFRVRAVCEYLSHKVGYRHSARKFDCWLFPEETLQRAGGDCEDLAFLTAALLEACGVSHACIRVAFGRIIDHRNPNRGGFHVWVVVQREAGGWEILEPGTLNRAARAERPSLPGVRGRAERGTDLEYVPHYVLNRDHLWRIRASESAAAMRLDEYLDYRVDHFWSEFNPRFAVKVHEHIFDTALDGLMSADDIAEVKRHSLSVDLNVLGYDPRDHFDFAYVDAGWKQVRHRLGRKDLESFALAAHAIGDFTPTLCTPTACLRRTGSCRSTTRPRRPIRRSFAIRLRTCRYRGAPRQPTPQRSYGRARSSAASGGDRMSTTRTSCTLRRSRPCGAACPITMPSLSTAGLHRTACGSTRR